MRYWYVILMIYSSSNEIRNKSRSQSAKGQIKPSRPIFDADVPENRHFGRDIRAQIIKSASITQNIKEGDEPGSYY